MASVVLCRERDALAPPFTLLVALVWQCRGWLLAAVGRAVSPCHF